MAGPISLQNRMRDSVESAVMILCSSECMSGGLDAATGAARDRRAGSVSLPARSDHRHEAFAGDAGAHGGLGLPGAGVRSGLHGRPWPAAAADALDGGARDPQAHLCPVRRGAVRALGGEPLLPVLL